MSLFLVKKFDKNTSNFIYKLRNKKYVRDQSKSKKKIMIYEHELWFKKFINNFNNNFYIIKYKGINAGYLRTVKKKINKVVSWALLKEYQNKGIMTRNLIKLTSNKKFKYRACVKKNNTPSLKMAYKAGFTKSIKRGKFVYLYKF